MPPSLSPDCALALAASVRSLRHLWLHVECCGAAIFPLRTMHGRGSLADVVLAMRCKRCGEAPRAATLLDSATGGMPTIWGGREPWRLVVVGGG